MKNHIIFFYALLFSLVFIFIGGIIGGLILFWIWPGMVKYLFPGAVETGLIIEKIGLWQSFFSSIIFFCFYFCLQLLKGLYHKVKQNNRF